MKELDITPHMQLTEADITHPLNSSTVCQVFQITPCLYKATVKIFINTYSNQFSHFNELDIFFKDLNETHSY